MHWKCVIWKSSVGPKWPKADWGSTNARHHPGRRVLLKWALEWHRQPDDWHDCRSLVPLKQELSCLSILVRSMFIHCPSQKSMVFHRKNPDVTGVAHRCAVCSYILRQTADAKVLPMPNSTTWSWHLSSAEASPPRCGSPKSIQIAAFSDEAMENHQDLSFWVWWEATGRRRPLFGFGHVFQQRKVYVFWALQILQMLDIGNCSCQEA